MHLTGKQSNSWHGAGDRLLRCPVPGCGHTAQIITKAHCRIAHNMERDDVGKQYGMPGQVMGRSTF